MPKRASTSPSRPARADRLGPATALTLTTDAVSDAALVPAAPQPALDVAPLPAIPAGEPGGFARLFGTTSESAARALTMQALDVMPTGTGHENDRLRALTLVQGLAPRDTFEAMVATQMIGVHNATMEMLRRSLQPNQSSDTTDRNIARVTRLTRAFTQLNETLERHRGRGSEQRVVVEHVHVHAGGQAIVGAVGAGNPPGASAATPGQREGGVR